MKRFLQALLLLAVVFAPLCQAAGADGDEGKRTWRERGKNLVGAVIASQVDRVAKGNKDGKDEAAKPLKLLGQFPLKESLLALVDEYKEQYKAEGRAYARELGDILAARIREDPKISGTLTTVQALCWAVIAYLTFVTLFLVVAVYRMHRNYARVLELLEKKQKE